MSYGMQFEGIPSQDDSIYYDRPLFDFHDASGRTGNSSKIRATANSLGGWKLHIGSCPFTPNQQYFFSLMNFLLIGEECFRTYPRKKCVMLRTLYFDVYTHC
jgi:hypothetical protein